LAWYALALARVRAGSNSAARIAMIAITTSSSISVKPPALGPLPTLSFLCLLLFNWDFPYGLLPATNMDCLLKSGNFRLVSWFCNAIFQYAISSDRPLTRHQTRPWSCEIPASNDYRKPAEETVFWLHLLDSPFLLVEQS